MTPNLLPCPCKGEIEYRFNYPAGSGGCEYICENCGARTPQCPDKPTAARVWNASVMAAQPGCEGVVGLTWLGDQLLSGNCGVGTVFDSINGGFKHSHSFERYATREAARAALLAHVLGDGK